MAMTDELTVRKQRVAVALRLLGGERLEGKLFVFHESGPGVFLWTRVLAFLNDAAPSFPFVTDEGNVVLVGRAKLLDVTLLADETNDEDPAVYFTGEARARVVLADGSRIEGTVYLDTDVEHVRLSDLLARPEPFFHLRSERSMFVNKLQLLTAHPLDG